MLQIVIEFYTVLLLLFPVKRKRLKFLEIRHVFVKKIWFGLGKGEYIYKLLYIPLGILQSNSQRSQLHKNPESRDLA